MILNLGLEHPATHGTLRLVVRLDGERVIAAYRVIGYMHRGDEKLSEFRTYPQITTLINRIHSGRARSPTRCRSSTAPSC